MKQRDVYDICSACDRGRGRAFRGACANPARERKAGDPARSRRARDRESQQVTGGEDSLPRRQGGGAVRSPNDTTSLQQSGHRN